MSNTHANYYIKTIASDEKAKGKGAGSPRAESVFIRGHFVSGTLFPGSSFQATSKASSGAPGASINSTFRLDQARRLEARCLLVPSLAAKQAAPQRPGALPPPPHLATSSAWRGAAMSAGGSGGRRRLPGAQPG